MTIKEHIIKTMQIKNPIWKDRGITGEPRYANKEIMNLEFVRVDQIYKKNAKCCL